MRKFAYRKNGDNIALFERIVSEDTTDGINYTEEWNTPDTDLTFGLLVEYSGTITSPTSETSDVDVSRMIALAIIDYVKYRMLEESGNEKRAMYYYGKFLNKIAREYTNKSGGIGMIMPRGAGVLR